MAIGLSNVNGRKAKRTAKPRAANVAGESYSSRAIVAGEAAEIKPAGDAWSSRGLAREGRSVRKERSHAAGELNTVWLDWSNLVAGTETSSTLLKTVRRILDLEMFVFEFLVYDLQIPTRTKKRILAIRSNAARALELRKLLSSRKV